MNTSLENSNIRSPDDSEILIPVKTEAISITHRSPMYSPRISPQPQGGINLAAKLGMSRSPQRAALSMQAVSTLCDEEITR